MDGLFKIFALLVIASALLIISKSQLRLLKGKWGELKVRLALKTALPASHYTVLNDVTVQTQRGFSQIDHIVVSPYGVFVIETRHMAGRIFGSEHEAQWTQAFYRLKKRFQNPLNKNAGHVKALQVLLGLGPAKFHSVVVFSGSAKIKSAMPVHVTRLGGLLLYIQSRPAQLLEFEEVERIAGVIESGRMASGAANRAARIASLQARVQAPGRLLEDGRRLLHRMRAAPFALRAASAGLVFALLLLAAGPAWQAENGLPAMTQAASSPFVQNTPPPQVSLPSVRQQARVEPDPAMTRLEEIRLQNSAAARQNELDERLAWEASLMCGYSTESMRCVCYEPDGGKVSMKFENCRALADKGGNY